MTPRIILNQAYCLVCRKFYRISLIWGSSFSPTWFIFIILIQRGYLVMSYVMEIETLFWFYTRRGKKRSIRIPLKWWWSWIQIQLTFFNLSVVFFWDTLVLKKGSWYKVISCHMAQSLRFLPLFLVKKKKKKRYFYYYLVLFFFPFPYSNTR